MFACAVIALTLAAARPAAAFGFDEVAALAQAGAQAPWHAQPPLAPALQALNYDAYRDIRYSQDRALWRADALPFELMFFHPGGPSQPVQINEIGPAGTRPVLLEPRDYDYGANKLLPASFGPIGHAGFRVHYPLNSAAYKDELITFLGASYFRAIGRDQHYGLSARGLALDTVGAGAEEFPVFKAFWILRPAVDAKALTLYAQMDSQRVTGAYQFTLHPGDETVVDVRARLFVRPGTTPIARFGIAPLTSMFQHGENAPRAGEFRPEVHDSDGLMIQAGDGQGGAEWLWRPLINPARVRSSAFAVRELKGFGLMQRDRAFSSYEDIEARYQRRPSAWVVPQGAWGAGRVELVELPTPDETHDNVVAYWVPAVPPAPGQALDLAYQIHWQGDVQQRPPNGWALQSRVGRGYAEPLRGETQYVVDFAGPALAALAPDARVEAVVTVDANARLIERNAYRNDAAGGWRMALRIQRIDATRPVELRAFLRHDNDALTETWTTLIQPD